jgi:hypothetical protein
MQTPLRFPALIFQWTDFCVEIPRTTRREFRLPIFPSLVARGNIRDMRFAGRAGKTAFRVFVPALTRCAVCKEAESAKHQGHAFERDETLPEWHGWYSLRRFHGTQVRHEAGNSDTSAKALGNSKDVFDKHYLKSTGVLPDVRKAVNTAMRGLIN